MAYEELFLELLRAESEDAVTAALQKFGLDKFSDANWIPYGGRGHENNFGIVGAQQADAIGALVEKVINSVDAVLMRECLARNLDPLSNVVPKSMAEAAELFLGIPEGNLAKLSTSQRAELADNNISIVFTGNKPDEGCPCVFVIDTGEGQFPEQFGNTLVSLMKSNKISVPFVQGKFNMGGTGSLIYCSPNKNYQLVASRRNLLLTGSQKSKWGFTIVRKRPPLRHERNERYEYLAPQQKVAELDLDEIPVLPDSTNTPYRRGLKSGTILKLYEYDLPKSTKTMATTDFYRALSIKLWNMVVPIRICETRPYKGHTLQATFSGMNIRLEEDKGDVLEPGFPCNFTLNVPTVGHVDGRICLFKRNADIQRWISSREAIVYTINGQCHGSIPNDFFGRNSVNLHWIRRQLLVNVDCSRLDPQLINRLFMTSRDRTREVAEKKRLEDALAEFLRKHAGLREWNERRHQEITAEKLGAETETLELFETLVSQNPALAEILGIGAKVKVPRPGDKPTEKFGGQRYPTFLKLDGHSPNEIFTKNCPANSYCRVVLSTDAENDYLVRAYDPGKLILKPDELVRSSSLYNGKLEIQIEPTPENHQGQTLEVKAMLTSPNATDGYFSVSFHLLIGSPIDPKTKPTAPSKPPKTSTVALPRIIEITKENWREDIEIGTDEDIVTIMPGEKTTESMVNMDNKHYKTYVYLNPKRAEEVKNLYKISATIMGLWLMDQVKKGDITDEKRRSLANSLGRLLLPMIDSLGGKLVELEKA